VSEAATRIYLVKTTKEAPGAATRLVRAPNAARALKHVTDKFLTVALAEADDLIAATKAGVEVEEAKNGEAA